jgi:hypothetical protein
VESRGVEATDAVGAELSAVVAAVVVVEVAGTGGADVTAGAVDGAGSTDDGASTAGAGCGARVRGGASTVSGTDGAAVTGGGATADGTSATVGFSAVVFSVSSGAWGATSTVGSGTTVVVGAAGSFPGLAEAGATPPVSAVSEITTPDARTAQAVRWRFDFNGAPIVHRLLQIFPDPGRFGLTRDIASTRDSLQVRDRARALASFSSMMRR